MKAFLKKAMGYLEARRKKSRWNVYASHASFYVLVSAIPLMMLTLMVVARLFPGGTDGFLAMVGEHLPAQIADYMPQDFVNNALSANFPLISITVLAMLWSASKGIRAVGEGLASVYGSYEETNAIKNYIASVLYTVIFLLAVLVALVLLVFGDTIVNAFRFFKSKYLDLSIVIARCGKLFSFLLFALVFAAMYKAMGGKRIPFKKHLPGAAVASAGWMLYSGLMSLYLSWFNPEKYLLYGSLGALLLLLLWVHSCMSILLFGAEVNVFFLNRMFLVRSSLPKKQETK